MDNLGGKELDRSKPVPLYLQFKSVLEEMIAERRERNISFIPKEEELARAYEVSRDTVAKAISLLVGEGVLYRIKRKGTFINREKTNLSNKSLIGILMPLGGVCSSCLKLMCEKIWSYGYETVVFEYTGVRDEKKLFRELVETCEGIIFNPDCEGHGMKLLEEAKRRKKKIVLLDIYYPEIKTGYVTSDNFQAAFSATEHLIGNGKKRIGFVSGSFTPSSVNERFEGYKEALRENGIPLDYNLRLVLHKPADELNFMVQVPFSLSQMMKDFILEKHPDAIIFAAHMHVFIALKAINELNLRIPEDIALLAFDNYLVDEFLQPPLTVIEQPLEQIASESVNMIINLIKGNMKEPLGLKLPANLKIRESSLIKSQGK